MRGEVAAAVANEHHPINKSFLRAGLVERAPRRWTFREAIEHCERQLLRLRQPGVCGDVAHAPKQILVERDYRYDRADRRPLSVELDEARLREHVHHSTERRGREL